MLCAINLLASPENYALIATPPGSGYLWCDVSSPLQQQMLNFQKYLFVNIKIVFCGLF